MAQQVINRDYYMKEKSRKVFKFTLCTICNSSLFMKVGKSFDKGFLWPLMTESSTQNQQFCSLGSARWRQQLKQLKVSPILVASMSTANIPMSNTLSWQVSAVYSAILLGPPCPLSHISRALFSFSFSDSWYCVTQFHKVFYLKWSWKDTKMPLLPVSVNVFTVMAYDKHGDNIINSHWWQPWQISV